MRKIKFRAWASNDNYPEGKMFYPGDKTFAVTFFGDVIHSSKSDGSEYCWARIAFNGLKLMQYTGLKDKDGNEIYEGDILQADNSEVGWCVYHNGCFSWFNGASHWHLLKQAHDSQPYDSIIKKCDDIEVIGNIYENPELMK